MVLLISGKGLGLQHHLLSGAEERGRFSESLVGRSTSRLIFA